ncbi:MAG: gliding motility-associated C-terminal domain-containing protein [Flavobacteriales bacterium]|nr:gliding motility-associated C-terminal domain-containing protein [Flavobacteriales bacterium]
MMRSIRLLMLLFGLLVGGGAWATHNQAGEILVCYSGVVPGGLLYEVTIITHTKTSSPADRPEFIVDWGDGSGLDTIARDNIIFNIAPDVQKNFYTEQHVYPGPGVYLLQYIDPNRIEGVVNIPNSVDVPMCVQTELIISVAGNNCSPSFLNSPIQNACLGQCWYHNPGAYDTDGDSLSFEPRVCLGADLDNDGDGDPIPGYLYPDQVGPGANNQYDIDPSTGTISWCAPQVQGVYNIAFAVMEWRKINGVWVNIGWVMRDMQVIVGPCNNQPPNITDLNDTCVTAGTQLTVNVSATDPNTTQTISLSAIGGPVIISPNPATFVSSPGVGSATGVLTWNTVCAHVRQQPYQVLFNAEDNDSPVELEDFESMFITVVAPPPQNPTATPDGSIMQLAWSYPNNCNNASGYLIYRRQGSFGFVPDNCELGVPAYTGYQLIASTNGFGNTTYADQGLAFGVTYCYMIVAVFPDGAQSYASVEFCNLLKREVPIMTKVSVDVTDATAGVDSVQWSNAFDLDTTQYPGPYQFKLYQGASYATANTLIHTSTLHPFLEHPDTTFVHNNINTVASPNAYRVELYYDNGAQLVGSGNTASSVFLVPDPNDEQVTLNITYNTPWVNDTFYVFRDNGGMWNFVGITDTTVYIDTGLVNGQEYCYYVSSVGAYSDPAIVHPLVNRSQEVCAIPVDRTPPCPPTLAILNDCETPLNTLTWNNPNNSCADDTYQYNVYFTDSLGGELQLIATINGAENTVFTHTDGASVAGCYAITAIDTVGNESAFTNIVCGDNCPVYTLPNVFSPNSDRVNDFFIPFPYRGVKEIDLKIYNRWGNLVFSTQDPAILWDGTNQSSKVQVPESVYYYTCLVTFKMLEGDELVQLKGYVHLLRGNNGGLD